MKNIFVSYSRRDGEAVDHIVARLEQDGFNVWIDREEIKAGELWHEAIVQAVDNAYAFVLMLSPGSATSDNVRKEVDLAEAANKELVPVLLAPVKLPVKLRYQLQKFLSCPTPKILDMELIMGNIKISPFGSEKQEEALN